MEWKPTHSIATLQNRHQQANDWPKTYRWTAALDLTDPQQATMQSAWQRTE
jgi:hypothetical protein